MKSVNSTEKAIILAQQLRELLQKGGFKLTKWLSNDREVLTAIPEGERASSVVNLDIDDLPTETALGLKWNVEEAYLLGQLTMTLWSRHGERRSQDVEFCQRCLLFSTH